MKKFLVFLCAIAFVFAMAGTASAVLVYLDIEKTGYGLGSVNVLYEGPVTYNNAIGWEGTFEGTIVDKEFESLGEIVLDVTYNGTLDWSSGFRWTEQITNNTSVSWIDYHLNLPGDGLFFSDAVFSPALVNIASTANPGGYTVTKLYGWGTLVLSDDNKSLSFYFDTPIASGATFGVHAPIEGLTNPSGSFQLVQNPSVPEPSTMLLLGSGLIGLGVLGRKKLFKK